MPFDGLTETQQNCLTLADYIEQQPEERFNMCGWAGCIAGHAANLWQIPHNHYYKDRWWIEGVAERLGLPDRGDPMFAMTQDRVGDPLDLDLITRSMAVATLSA